MWLFTSCCKLLTYQTQIQALEVTSILMQMIFHFKIKKSILMLQMHHSAVDLKLMHGKTLTTNVIY